MIAGRNQDAARANLTVGQRLGARRERKPARHQNPISVGFNVRMKLAETTAFQVRRWAVKAAAAMIVEATFRWKPRQGDSRALEHRPRERQKGQTKRRKAPVTEGIEDVRARGRASEGETWRERKGVALALGGRRGGARAARCGRRSASSA